MILPAVTLASGLALASLAQIQVSAGFVYKGICPGRLLASSVGDPKLIELEALPKSFGCAVFIKPRVSRGMTNLFLETTTGTISRFVVIKAGIPKSTILTLTVSGGER